MSADEEGNSFGVFDRWCRKGKEGEIGSESWGWVEGVDSYFVLVVLEIEVGEGVLDRVFEMTKGETDWSLRSANEFLLEVGIGNIVGWLNGSNTFVVEVKPKGDIDLLLELIEELRAWGIGIGTDSKSSASSKETSASIKKLSHIDPKFGNVSAGAFNFGFIDLEVEDEEGFISPKDWDLGLGDPSTTASELEVDAIVEPSEARFQLNSTPSNCWSQKSNDLGEVAESIILLLVLLLVLLFLPVVLERFVGEEGADEILLNEEGVEQRSGKTERKKRKLINRVEKVKVNKGGIN